MTAFDFIRTVPFINGSLSDPANESGLHRVLESTRARLAVEVGSFVGAGSTRVIGYWMREHDGHLVCVDTLCVDLHARGLCNVSHPHAFHSNIAHLGLGGVVSIFRSTSAEAAAMLNVSADLIYIDAGHSREEVWQDIRLWAAHLRDGGILCGDDANLVSIPGVDAALNHLRFFTHVETTGRFWWTPPLSQSLAAQIAAA